MKACVVLPTRHDNPQEVLRALGSVFAQTHEDWTCLVIGQADVSRLKSDPRLVYQPSEGSIAEMTEVGIRYAMDHADFWVPLRPNWWFQRYKLDFDVRVLQRQSAVYGPFLLYETEAKAGTQAGVGNVPFSTNVGRFMQQGIPVVSWANCAVRTTTLASLGKLLDPRLREHGSLLLNARLARVTSWAWRGEVGKEFFVAPSAEDFHRLRWGAMSLDAVAVKEPLAVEADRQADYLTSCEVLLEERV